MKKFDLFILLAIMLLAVGCESEVNVGYFPEALPAAGL